MISIEIKCERETPRHIGKFYELKAKAIALVVGSYPKFYAVQNSLYQNLENSLKIICQLIFKDIQGQGKTDLGREIPLRLGKVITTRYYSKSSTPIISNNLPTDYYIHLFQKTLHS
jgi:hypothetical protein